MIISSGVANRWKMAEEMVHFVICLKYRQTNKEQDVGQYWVSISTLVQAERRKEDEKRCQGHRFSGKLAN